MESHISKDTAPSTEANYFTFAQPKKEQTICN